mgnify:CR=1 FL=1
MPGVFCPLDLIGSPAHKRRMTFRFVLALGLGLPLGQAAAANHLLRVDAGQHERSGTPVTFPLPDAGQAHWQLTDPGGKAVAIQSEGHGSASFIVGKLAAFAEAPAFKALQYVPIDEVRCEGDAITRYEEAVSGGGIHVRLVWEELGEAKALELPRPSTGTPSASVPATPRPADALELNDRGRW